MDVFLYIAVMPWINSLISLTYYFIFLVLLLLATWISFLALCFFSHHPFHFLFVACHFSQTCNIKLLSKSKRFRIHYSRTWLFYSNYFVQSWPHKFNNYVKGLHFDNLLLENTRCFFFTFPYTRKVKGKYCSRSKVL